MCATYFHDLSRSQVTAWIYSSERWKKFRRSLEILRFIHLEILRLQGLRRKFCMNFHDLCAPKRRFLLWSSHTFWSSLLVRFTEKAMAAFSRFMRPKNEIVCCEVQPHFESSPPARFTEKSLVA